MKIKQSMVPHSVRATASWLGGEQGYMSAKSDATSWTCRNISPSVAGGSLSVKLQLETARSLFG